MRQKKKWKKYVVGLVGTMIVTLIVGVLYTVLTPYPAVWLLRKNFGGEPTIVNVNDYDAIKQQVEIYKDLPYPSQDGKNRYDVYLPKQRTGKLPTILWVHGGAFVAGSKDGIENYAVMLANEGYAVVGVDYEWAPEIQYPGQVRQVEESIRELNRVQDSYHLDMDQIILFGDSAGAHIAAQVALLASNSEYESALNLQSELTIEQIKGMVLYCGPYNVERMLHTGNAKIDFLFSRIGWALLGEKDWQNSELLQTTTIQNYVTPQFPPTFITDGNSGSFEKQGKELATAIDRQNVKVETLFFDKATYGDIPHEYQFNIGDNGAGSLCYEMTLAFLNALNDYER